MPVRSIEEARQARLKARLRSCSAEAGLLLIEVHRLTDELNMEKPPNSAEFALNLRAWSAQLPSA